MEELMGCWNNMNKDDAKSADRVISKWQLKIHRFYPLPWWTTGEDINEQWSTGCWLSYLVPKNMKIPGHPPFCKYLDTFG